MKPSELIKILQEAVDAGCDDTARILFDTEARTFDYHMAEIGTAYFEPEIDETPIISLHEKNITFELTGCMPRKESNEPDRTLIGLLG